MTWARRSLLLSILAVATPAFAQPRGAQAANADSVVRGLEAQYQAALIRERRLADDREQRLIADAEARLTRARAAADAAQGEARAVQAELEAARADYANLVAGIASRDAAARAEIDTYRREAADMVARANPEKLAALQRFADGDRVGAWPVLQEITERSVCARLAAANAAARADDDERIRLAQEMGQPAPERTPETPLPAMCTRA